jgi:hypothetical protein
MTVQSVAASLTIEWDDSAVLVFSFVDQSGNKWYCGFPHVIPAVQQQVGSQTQVNTILQVLQQTALQVTADPQTWVETVKNGARGNKVTVVFEDSTTVVYTTQTNQSFTLQQLFSVAG